MPPPLLFIPRSYMWVQCPCGFIQHTHVLNLASNTCLSLLNTDLAVHFLKEAANTYNLTKSQKMLHIVSVSILISIFAFVLSNL